MRNILIILIISCVPFGTYAQQADWVDQMLDPNVNFYTVQQSFEEYWNERTLEKGKGWKQFKRWEAFMEPRVFPTGERPNPSILAQGAMAAQAFPTNLGQWRPVGPFDGNSLNGIGRINRLTFDPQNTQIIWAGAPSGGLWKSIDGGVTWTTNTDLFENLGVSEIVINPNNSDTMYIATGDQDGADTYSFGVLSSYDGGLTWGPTGLSSLVTQQRRVYDLYLNPNNPAILLAATSTGLMRSTDHGQNWTSVRAGAHNNIVQKPGNADVLYATSLSGGNSRIFKSTDNGITWTQQTSNLPTSGIRRIELAVTADDPDYVYAVYGATNNGFHSVYRTTNEGTTWLLRANSPNLLGWSTTGSDAGGQAWYDLAIEVDPLDKDEVFVGGVNIWRSTNGGSTWNLAAHWFGGGGAPFVHADIHHLKFTPSGSFLYAGTDGGVYRKSGTGNSWTELKDGMNITQYYRMSASVTDTTRIIAGAQDNGTHLVINGNWDRVRGGDGMDCAIDPQRQNIMYASSQFGNFGKSTNSGQSFNATFNLTPNGTGNWVTPFLIDPKHPDTIYAGYSRLYRSFNAGITFSAVSPSGLTGGSNIDQMAISPSHTNNILISEGNDLWHSDDRGVTWTNLSSNLPGGAAITFMAFDQHHPDTFYVTRSGYTATQKVFYTDDGGQTFTNLSTGLPNVPVNCVVTEDNNLQSVYIGTDVGVFYRDVNNTSWLRFNSALPNVIVNDLEINYINKKIRAGTYGRGIWESPVFSELVPPVAGIDLPASICLGDTVQFFDASLYNPDNFEWKITPSTFTFVNGTDQFSEDPELVFQSKGIYDIQLKVSNTIGEDSTLFVSAFAVGGFPIPLTEDFEQAGSLNKWELSNSGSFDWAVEPISGPNQGSRAAGVQIFGSGAAGSIHELISPTLDLTGHDSVWLAFDYAYTGTSTNTSDSLKVYISTACSDSWSLIQAFGENGSQNFVTASAGSGVFVPATAGDWCGNPSFGSCPVIDLTAYAGLDGVRVKFVAENDGGNNIYLDNINIQGNPNSGPTAGFGGPTAECALRPVNFLDQSFGSPSQYEWTFTGGTPATSSLKNPTITYDQAGTYDVKLKVTNAFGSDSLINVSQIVISPADSVSLTAMAAASPICPGDTFSVSVVAQNAGSTPVYDWYRNGQLQGSTNTPDYDYLTVQNGDEVYATVRSSESCAWPLVAYSDTVTVQVHPNVNVQVTTVAPQCISDPAITLAANPPGGVFSGPGVSGGSFDPNVAGFGVHVVTYTYTDPNSCVHTATTPIRVDLPVTLTFNTIAGVCENDNSFRLSAAQPLGGNYSGPGVYGNFFYPDSAGVGTHVLTYNYTAGACAAVSATGTITVFPAPPTPTVSIVNGDMQCDQTGVSYQWLGVNGVIFGATSRTYGPSFNGTFRVRITDQNGCESTSAPVNFSIGIEELENQAHLELFPNPAEDRISIKLNTFVAGNNKLLITNSIGKILMIRDLPKATEVEEGLDISGLASGIYILSVEGESANISKRFIVK